jgi:hypothetical protein
MKGEKNVNRKKELSLQVVASKVNAPAKFG